MAPKRGLRRAAGGVAPALERDDFSSNRHPALSFCLSLFGKPVPTFPDHALVAKRARQCPYIVPDHINVSGSVALFARQTVGIERSADPGAGLGRYPPDQAGIADTFEENRRDFCGPDLTDNAGDVAGARLGFRGNP